MYSRLVPTGVEDPTYFAACDKDHDRASSSRPALAFVYAGESPHAPALRRQSRTRLRRLDARDCSAMPVRSQQTHRRALRDCYFAEVRYIGFFGSGERSRFVVRPDSEHLLPHARTHTHDGYICTLSAEGRVFVVASREARNPVTVKRALWLVVGRDRGALTAHLSAGVTSRNCHVFSGP